MKIQSAKWTRIDFQGEELESVEAVGLPALKLRIDGKDAMIVRPLEMIGRGLDYVFLGPDWEDEVPRITIPANDEHREVILEGHTGDKKVVRLVKEFNNAVVDGTFEPKEIEV